MSSLKLKARHTHLDQPAPLVYCGQISDQGQINFCTDRYTTGFFSLLFSHYISFIGYGGKEANDVGLVFVFLSFLESSAFYHVY